MENEIKVSVIMPVYNSGQYLKTAINSILSQSLREIELILVDDGSTDGSSERCDEYAAADSRVVVIHQKNGGVCNARNAALKVASGEYIGFSDHDDEFIAGCHEKAYNYAKQHNLEMVKFGHKAIKTNGKAILKTWNFQYKEEIIESEDTGYRYLELLSKGEMECVWDSLYRRSFIEKNSLQLDTSFKGGGEDIDFNGRVIGCKPRLGIMHDVFYMHYIRIGFSTSSKFNEANIEKAMNFPRRLKGYLSTFDFDRIVKESPTQYTNAILYRTIGSLLFSTAMTACPYSTKKISSLLEEIRQDKNIKEEFYKVPQLSMIAKSIKYGMLYVAFLHRWYWLCQCLYGVRKVRDKILSTSSINKNSEGTKNRVTVITLQNVRNYGSVLQALATQQAFKQLGCEVDFINYNKNGRQSYWKRAQSYSKDKGLIAKLVYPFILMPSFIKEDKVFKDFIKKHLNQQEKEYCCIDDFRDFPIASDVYCTGSDQTWNSGWNNGILPELFLKFVPDNVKKIAYAASIGKEKLDDWEVEETKSLLSRYQAISVRESSAKDIVEKQLGLPSATHVLDPTLQVDKEFWMSVLGESYEPKYKKGEYVLVYQLNTNPDFDNYAEEFAKRKGWKLIRFCIRHYQALRCGKAELIPNVEDFIGLIANAGCVITDSFHATAFSCNMNTPMICIYPNSYSSRLASLLKLVGLEDRHLTDYNDFSFVEHTEIDFTPVNEMLNRERKVGYDFLAKALSN